MDINEAVLDCIQHLKSAFKPHEYNKLKYIVDMLGCYYCEEQEASNCCICHRCKGCENCFYSLCMHTTEHWSKLNKILFLYAIGMQYRDSDHILNAAFHFDGMDWVNTITDDNYQDICGNQYKLLLYDKEFELFKRRQFYIYTFKNKQIKKNCQYLANKLFAANVRAIHYCDGLQLDHCNELLIPIAICMSRDNQCGLYEMLCTFYKMNNERDPRYSNEYFHKFGIGKLRSINHLMNELNMATDETLDVFVITLYNEIKKIYNGINATLTRYALSN